MATQQPVWRLVANLGDVHPIDYGGFFVFVDETGVYPPQAELLESPDDDAGTWFVYRFDLEPHTFVDGVLSDNPFHPSYAVWYADKLDGVAATCDVPADALRADLCADDAVRRARAYQTLVSYFGAHEFDSYPLELTRDDAEKRYDGLKPALGEPDYNRR